MVFCHYFTNVFDFFSIFKKVYLNTYFQFDTKYVYCVTTLLKKLEVPRKGGAYF